MSRFSWQRRDNLKGVEDRLRRFTPEADEEFVGSLAARAGETTAKHPLRRPLAVRLVLVGVVSASLALAFAWAGGAHKATSSLVGAYHAVSDVVTSGSTSSSNASANGQYNGAKCGNPNFAGDPTKRVKCPAQAGPKNQTEGNAGSSSVAVPLTIVNYTPDLPVSFSYKTTDLSASAGSDYAATSGKVTFNVGETAKSVPVTINGDKKKESDEYLLVVLYNPSSNGEVLGSYANVVGATYVKIANDD